MKKLFIIKFPVILLMLLIFILPVKASSSIDLQNSTAQNLFKLKIMQGDDNGDLRLQDKIKRSEFITLMVRILGYENETNLDNIKVPFKDISKEHWAYNYVRISYKYGLVDGYPDNTIAPDNFITLAEAQTVLVKALGYKDAITGSWPENVLSKASQLGIDKNLDIPANKQITRGETSVLVNNSLIVNFGMN